MIKKGDWVKLSDYGLEELTSDRGMKKTWRFAKVVGNGVGRRGVVKIQLDGHRSIQHFHSSFLEVVDMLPAVEPKEFNIFERQHIERTRQLIESAIKRAGWIR